MDILVSYVANNNDLGLLDKSCMSNMPAMNMTPTAKLVDWLGTDEAYKTVQLYLRLIGAISSTLERRVN